MAEKKWTVMFYLAGDNNLSEDMISSLIGMQKVMMAEGADDKVNLVAIYDSSYPTVKIEHYNFTHNNSSKELKDCVKVFPTVKRRRNDTAYIIDFVKAVAANPEWKAENYAIILSGHSDAILGKTMFRDTNPETTLHLGFLANILESAAREELPKQKFDLIGFDSCMMGMLEVGCELDKAADVLVSSQGFAPTAGWNYEETLKDLIARNGEMDAKEFGISIAKNQIASAKNYRVGGRSMNLSSVNLREAKNLKRELNKLAKIFNGILDAPVTVDDVTSKAQAEANAVILDSTKNLIHDSHYYSQTFLHEQAVDILDFVSSLCTNCHLKLKEIEVLFGTNPQKEAGRLFKEKLNQIKTQCEKLKTAVKDYLLENQVSGPDYQFSKGVSVFFPWTMLAFNMVFQRYKDLEFSRFENDNEWFKFIEKFTQITFRGKGEPRFELGNDFLTWKGDVAAANKASTAKDTDDTRASTAKASTAKAETEMFYRFFSRFRNHPIFHDVP